MKKHDMTNPYDETIYSEINGSSSKPPALYGSTSNRALSTVFPQQLSIHSNPNSPSNLQTNESYCDTALPEPHFNPSLQNQLFSKVKGLQNCKDEENIGISGSDIENVMKVPSTIQHGEMSSIHLSEELPIESSSTFTFPVQVSMEFPQHLELSGSQDDISCFGNLESKSVSTSTTPVMHRSFSTFSHSSSTILFPFKKGKWVSPDTVIKPEVASFATGRTSPSTSEISRTESALAPPPSNASLSSNTTENSKTESTRETLVFPVEREERFETSQSHSAQEVVATENENSEAQTFSNNMISKEKKSIEDNQCRKISLGSAKSQLLCMLQPHVSSGIHNNHLSKVSQYHKSLKKKYFMSFSNGLLIIIDMKQ